VVDEKQAIENLHKWFPILVRFPKLMPLARRTMNSKLLSKPLLWMYMLYSEWLVTEQNKMYQRAQGLKGFKHWAPWDFTKRVAVKGTVRVIGLVGGNVVSKMSTKLQMGDERVVAHMD
jgi:hypothetical protein